MQNTELRNNSLQLMCAFHEMFLFIWLATATDYHLWQGQNCVGSYSSQEIKQNGCHALIG